MAWSKWKNKLVNGRAQGWVDINIKFTPPPPTLSPKKESDLQYLKHHLNKQDKSQLYVIFAPVLGKLKSGTIQNLYETFKKV